MLENKFKVYDDYELDMEFLGEFDTLVEAKACAKERDMDTDGECDVVIYEASGFEVKAIY